MSSFSLLRLLAGIKSPQQPLQAIPVVRGRQQPYKRFKPLTDAELLLVTDRSNPRCPFYDRIGQDTVIEQLLALLVERLRNEYHEGPSCTALMFTGPASTGKTDFTELLMGKKGLALPFVQTDAKKVRGADTILELMKHAAQEWDVALRPLGRDCGRIRYECPPMGILIDEVHGLTNAVMDNLLKALEADDHLLVTEQAVVDCRHVLWIGATTQRGEIILKNQPFDSRFEKIEFNSYTRSEVTEILRRRFGWPVEACEALAVRGGGIVREALAIGRKVDRQLELMRLRNRAADIMMAIAKVGEQLGIDESGMSDKQLAVLQALARHYPKGMTYPQLAKVINRTVKELQEAVLPALQLESADQQARVTWSGRNYITEAGMAELLHRDLVSEEQVQAFKGVA